LLTETANAGDVVLFAEISRMARSTLHVLEMLEHCMTQGVVCTLPKQQMVLDGSMPNRITATVLGLVAEIERDWLVRMIREMAATYGVSETTVYRALQAYTTPQAVHWGDRGTPWVLPQNQIERYCELITAMKLRTANKQGRHLSTAETIRLLEDHGVETPNGFVRAPKGLLKRSTVNR
jgi:predicted DNA-binding transcriptional regulator AlpA